MNKTAIKNYAIWARTALLQAVKQKAFEYEITEAEQPDPGLTAIEGRLLSEEERRQRRELIEKIRTDGYEQVMEQTAYIWFNRFIALRFMEVNGYLPSRIRVFTDDKREFRPEILKEAMELELEGLSKEKVFDYLEKQDNEALYKYLLLTQCNALNKSLPYMFEKIDNYTELLFPKGLLKEGSVIGRMISDIPEEDWTDQVQIIGWLYQYYNSELKDDTFTKLKKNIKISKERIPAATQLFTPDWIVRYMVENSLGRLWLEGHPNDSLKAEWKYYIEEAEQEPEVEMQLAEIRKEYQAIKPEELKIIDPCMGSGHILVYAFDVLMQIYTSAGWSERDAAKSIVENNLYGLDIDDRAGQLAYFSVMMEARKYNRRILNGEVKSNLVAIMESGFMTDELIHYVAGKDQTIKESLTYLRGVFKDAKEYGSILTIKELNFVAIYDRLDAIEAETPVNLIDQLLQQSVVENLRPVIKQAEMLAGKYDVVVTNPPYMGGSGMDAKLSNYVKENYPDSKSDLFAVFIERCGEMTKANRFQTMITQHAWMFLSSYEKLREKLMKTDIVNMVHLGARAFEEIGGEVVQTTSFVIQKKHEAAFKGTYCRLIEPTTQQGKEDMFLAGENRYVAQQANFAKIPGKRMGYWLNTTLQKQFEKPSVSAYADTRRGLQTGDSGRFIRRWYEVFEEKEDLSLDRNSKYSDKKWFLFNSGGSFRRWYGNIIDIVNWENGGKTIKQTGKAIIPSEERYFDEVISWNKISSGQMAVRYQPTGIIPGDASPFLHSPKQNQDVILYAMAILNSKISAAIVEVLSPTLNFEVGNIAEVPMVIDERFQEAILQKVRRCITDSKYDWDSYEISWNFKLHPLV